MIIGQTYTTVKSSLLDGVFIIFYTLSTFMSFHKIFIKTVSMGNFCTTTILALLLYELIRINMIIPTGIMRLTPTLTAVQNGCVSVRRPCVLQLHDECTAEKP